MNTDSTFQIGKDHIVCEDYALSSNLQDRITFAIVCDGCSASPDVDFGARALALSAKRTFGLDNASLSNSQWFGDTTIQNAQRVFDVFPSLHPQALDATLLAAWIQNNILTAYIYGDGVLVHRSKAGIKSVHIHLTSGAPDYLSYQLDPDRMNGYKGLKDNRKEVWTSYNGIHDYKPFVPFVYESPVEDGDVIAVISDGINSFRKADSTPIDWTELVDEFTAYKTTEGQFVQRRIGAFKRKCVKEGITHSDDISIASIVV